MRADIHTHIYARIYCFRKYRSQSKCFMMNLVDHYATQTYSNYESIKSVQILTYKTSCGAIT